MIGRWIFMGLSFLALGIGSLWITIDLKNDPNLPVWFWRLMIVSSIFLFVPVYLAAGVLMGKKGE